LGFALAGYAIYNDAVDRNPAAWQRFNGQILAMEIKRGLVTQSSVDVANCNRVQNSFGIADASDAGVPVESCLILRCGNKKSLAVNTKTSEGKTIKEPKWYGEPLMPIIGSLILRFCPSTSFSLGLLNPALTIE
jgi:hypothetical protein